MKGAQQNRDGGFAKLEKQKLTEMVQDNMGKKNTYRGPLPKHSTRKWTTVVGFVHASLKIWLDNAFKFHADAIMFLSYITERLKC